MRDEKDPERLVRVNRGGTEEYVTEEAAAEMDDGAEMREFVKSHAQKKRSVQSAYDIHIMDKKTGALTPGFEEFARNLAWGHDQEFAWGKAFPHQEYSKTLAGKLKYHPIIAQRVEAILKLKRHAEVLEHRSAIAANNLTADWVIQRLMENSILGSGGTITRAHPESGEIEVITGQMDLAASNKATENLGKLLGMWVDDPRAKERDANSMSHEQLVAELVAQRAQNEAFMRAKVKVETRTNADGTTSVVVETGGSFDGAEVIDVESDGGSGRWAEARAGASEGAEPARGEGALGEEPPRLHDGRVAHRRAAG